MNPSLRHGHKMTASSDGVLVILRQRNERKILRFIYAQTIGPHIYKDYGVLPLTIESIVFYFKVSYLTVLLFKIFT